MKPEKEQRSVLIRIVVSAVLGVAAAVLTGKVFTDVPWWARLAAFLVPYLICGGEVLREAAENLLHGEVFDEEFLMALATVGAFAVGEYPEAVFVMVLYQTGELLGDVASDRSRDAVSKLMDLRPDRATVLRDGAEVVLAPEEVRDGEELIVKPGDRIPLDCVVLSGESAVDASSLTGESTPAEVGPGDRLSGGTVNLEGLLRARACGTWNESAAARILRLMEESRAHKAKSENFITRFSRIYTPCVVGAALLLAVVPPLFTGEWSVWIYRALTFLVVSCPCALVISVPLTFFCGLGAASASGILIKGSDALERLARADTAVFDKTGTLTTGNFTVDRVLPAEGVKEEELLELTALAESRSSHPIARSIITAWGKPVEDGRLEQASENRGHTGRGIAARIDGKDYIVGNEAAVAAGCPDLIPTTQPGTAVYAAQGSRYLGCIIVSDEVKPEAAQAVRELKKLGFDRTVILTGDGENAAAAAAAKVGVKEHDCFAGLLPEGKTAEVERLRQAGRRVIFVGDGINDAPVLGLADVGVAMGALGSDAAIEAADAVLADDDLARLPRAVRLSRRTLRIVRENILLALAVKAAVLLLGALGITGMWAAAVGDVGVMLAAVLNALRALRKC